MQQLSRKKQEEHRELEKLTKKFLKAGGKIQVLTNGQQAMQADKLPQRMSVKKGWQNGRDGLGPTDHQIKTEASHDHADS